MTEGSGKTGASATVDDVAKYFGVTTRTVRRWLKETTIPHSRPGGSIRFNIDEVAEWAEDVTADSEPEPAA